MAKSRQCKADHAGDAVAPGFIPPNAARLGENPCRSKEKRCHHIRIGGVGGSTIGQRAIPAEHGGDGGRDGLFPVQRRGINRDGIIGGH